MSRWQSLLSACNNDYVLIWKTRLINEKNVFISNLYRMVEWSIFKNSLHDFKK